MVRFHVGRPIILWSIILAQLLLILLVVFAIVMPTKTKDFINDAIDKITVITKVVTASLDHIDNLDKK